jgi:hypothetical protein
MVNQPARVNVRQTLKRQAVPLLFHDQPCIQCFLHDHLGGPLELPRQSIELFGKGQWEVCREKSGFHASAGFLVHVMMAIRPGIDKQGLQPSTGTRRACFVKSYCHMKTSGTTSMA